MAASPEPKRLEDVKAEIEERCKEVEMALKNGARATVKRKLKATVAQLRVPEDL